MPSSPKEAFEAVVGPHFDALYRAAYRLTGRHSDAQDLVQDVCLRAFIGLAELETLERPRGWLLKVQYRLFVDGVRRRRRAPFDAIADIDDCDSEAPGPEQATDAVRAQAALANVWPRLGREQRALLALHAEGFVMIFPSASEPSSMRGGRAGLLWPLE